MRPSDTLPRAAVWAALAALALGSGCGTAPAQQTPERETATAPGVGSCDSSRSFSESFCGAHCTPSFAQLVRYVGETICAGSETASGPHGNCGVAALDLESGATVTHRGSEPVYAASSIKYIMVAAALYYRVPPARLSGYARNIFRESSNCSPSDVLDELQQVLNADPNETRNAADAVNDFMHDVVGMSERSSFTRWCPTKKQCTKATCHVATNCTTSAYYPSCGDREALPLLTAQDAIRFLRFVATTDFSGRSELRAWSAPAASQTKVTLLGLTSCGLETVPVEHKVGSLWFDVTAEDDAGLTYNDLAIIHLPGREPLLVAFLDGRQAVQGQQGQAAFALYRLLVDGVLDFYSGTVDHETGEPETEPGEPETGDPDTEPGEPSPTPDDGNICAALQPGETGGLYCAANPGADPVQFPHLYHCSQQAGAWQTQVYNLCPNGCAPELAGVPDRCR